jgi:DNA modification methylase
MRNEEKANLGEKSPKLDLYLDNSLQVGNLTICVLCPKKYYQLLSLTECQGCKDYLGVKNSQVLCNYKEEREQPSPGNKVNDLSGSEWLFFTKSVMRSSFPSEFGHDLRKEHGASKPPRLMKLIIEFFTKPGETVLDPFAGVGGTLIGASLCNRKAVGIEINRHWIDIYEKVIERENIEKQTIIHGDCIEELSKFVEQGTKFNSIITDPPYSPALEKTLCDGKYGWARRRTNLESFSDDPRDFRNSKKFEEYYDKMEEACGLMYKVLENNRYLVMMIRDSYQDGKYIPASFYVAQRAQKVGFTFKGVKIWYNTGAPLRPYGYPFSYVPNIIHHNILVFKK